MHNKYKIKILHVTQSLGGGVLHYLSQLSTIQASDGHLVHIAHSIRPDTPTELLPDLFPGSIKRLVVPMRTQISIVHDFYALCCLFILFLNENPDIIHLHSSKAGVLGRVAGLITWKKKRVFYTPHGFSFLQENISNNKKKLYFYIEKVAGLFGGTLIGCSNSETELAINRLKIKNAVVVENAIDFKSLVKKKVFNDKRVRVVTSGRITYQKAPERFKYIAENCTDLAAQFTWLGDGELFTDLMTNGKFPDNLKVLGWVPRPAVLNTLADADLFVLTSLWEGMPLALIEAQATGLPAIVSDVVGNRDVVIDGITGFVCKSNNELLEKTRLLIKDGVRRKEFAQAAKEMAASRFNIERMYRDINLVYNKAINIFNNSSNTI